LLIITRSDSSQLMSKESIISINSRIKLRNLSIE